MTVSLEFNSSSMSLRVAFHDIIPAFTHLRKSLDAPVDSVVVNSSIEESSLLLAYLCFLLSIGPLQVAFPISTHKLRAAFSISKVDSRRLSSLATRVCKASAVAAIAATATTFSSHPSTTWTEYNDGGAQPTPPYRGRRGIEF